MRKALVPFLLVAALALASGCSGSDGKKEASSKKTTTTTSSTTTTTNPALAPDDVDADASPFCADWKQLRSAPDITPTGDQAKDDATRLSHYQELLPTVEQLVEHADADVKPAAQTALDVVRKVIAAKGDPAEFLTDRSKQATKDLGDYARAHCTARS